ncbi:double-stranded RNA-binding protein 1-like [Camellia sinensis]|uniref:double-stranded RNA-binding protein 1-like n=1 Tax=Camellia sinensis TaxID=4442 RepID=UPI00103628ED|nr:double-stranded RNA-binding protein 1-like [Camellia sinensis]
MYKNRLQEYTQKSSIPLPVYETINEGGVPHEPRFRSTVRVDGASYTSHDVFSQRKAAEQDVARVALDDPPELAMYKNPLQEFIQKSSIPLPVYETINEGGVPHEPRFRSTVRVDGASYTSHDVFSQRKAAEQDVAKVALDDPPKLAMYKNPLQESTQKSSIPLPVYETINEGGVPHEPRFRSTVRVDGASYTSHDVFSQRKAAEQDVVRVALDDPPELAMYKNPLQEYTQKSSIPLSVYETINEGGVPHEPRFRSTVRVDGASYTSHDVFSQRKAAEQDVVRVALDDPSELAMHKNRLQEYTQKSSIPLPVYETINEGGVPHEPRFRSTVRVDGASYTSHDVLSQRKAAEQDVGRVALDGITQKILIREVCVLNSPMGRQPTKSRMAATMVDNWLARNADRPPLLTLEEKPS